MYVRVYDKVMHHVRQQSLITVWWYGLFGPKYVLYKESKKKRTIEPHTNNNNIDVLTTMARPKVNMAEYRLSRSGILMVPSFRANTCVYVVIFLIVHRNYA
jgi:hypothetical protein